MNALLSRSLLAVGILYLHCYIFTRNIVQWPINFQVVLQLLI